MRRFFKASILLLMLLASGSVLAEGRLQLTFEIKERLIALEKLAGPSLDRTAFTDKPVLISFFASW